MLSAHLAMTAASLDPFFCPSHQEREEIKKQPDQMKTVSNSFFFTAACSLNRLTLNSETAMSKTLPTTIKASKEFHGSMK